MKKRTIIVLIILGFIKTTLSAERIINLNSLSVRYKSEKILKAKTDDQIYSIAKRVRNENFIISITLRKDISQEEYKKIISSNENFGSAVGKLTEKKEYRKNNKKGIIYIYQIDSAYRKYFTYVFHKDGIYEISVTAKNKSYYEIAEKIVMSYELKK